MLVLRTATKVPKHCPLGSHWDPLQRFLTTQPKCLIYLRQRLKKCVSKIRQRYEWRGKQTCLKAWSKETKRKREGESLIFSIQPADTRDLLLSFCIVGQIKCCELFRDLLTLNMPFTWTWRQCYDAAVGWIKPSLVHSLIYLSSYLMLFVGWPLVVFWSFFSPFLLTH